MDIATALMNGTMETNAEGVQMPRPPTALATRAATYIRNLESQHQIHLQQVLQLQTRESLLLQDLENHRKQIKEQDEEVQNLRKNQSTISNVDSSSTELPRSDSVS